MITYRIKNKEVDIHLEYRHELGNKPKIYIEGEGDFSHHLIEGAFDIIDMLAQTENCGHRKGEWIRGGYRPFVKEIIKK